MKVTEQDRAQQGIPSKERVQKLPAGAASTARRPASRKPLVVSPSGENDGGGSRYASVGAAGAAVGAIAAGLATWYLATDKTRPTRKQAAAVRLNERLSAVEGKLGRVSRIREYLDQVEVKDRIDKVEREIVRAGRHVRAKETGRPLWMVRLADAIGGRWSNL